MNATNPSFSLKAPSICAADQALNLGLVAARLSPSSGLLKLPALGAHIGLGVGVGHSWCLAKVLHSLPGVLRASQEDAICSSRSQQGQLVKCQTLSSSLQRKTCLQNIHSASYVAYKQPTAVSLGIKSGLGGNSIVLNSPASQRRSCMTCMTIALLCT